MDVKKFFVESIIHWAENGNLRSFPWRKTSKIWNIAVAEILLTRTPAYRVLPVYQNLLNEYPFPDRLNTKDLPNLVKILSPLGLQEKKAIQIKILADILQQRKNREVLMKELKEVPGIGKYSYNAVLLFGFKIVRPIVDGNVGRIFSRYFGLQWESKAVSSSKAWNLAYELVPKTVSKAIIYSYGLLDFGSEICKKKPRCQECPLVSYCKFSKKIFS